MVRALFDTNVLIDHLNNVEEAGRELERYDDKAVSVITWIEVMAGAAPRVEAATRAFLKNFHVIALDDAVAELAAALRRQHKMRLSDAMIWASARANSMLFVTRNIKDFPADNPGVRIPYRLHLKTRRAR